MKYSFMSFSTPALSLSEILATARLYGYDGIEPRIDSQHAHGIEVTTTADQRCRIVEQVSVSGIELACLASSIVLANPEKNDQMRQQAHERIDLAGDLKVPIIRLFGGCFPEDFSRQQASELLVQSLRQLADHAAERQVCLCLETHDAWCNPEDVAVVMRQVNHPAVGVNWDIMHPVRIAKFTIEKSFEILKPWIRHLHIHDGISTVNKLQFVSIGQGEIDHWAALQCLRTINYPDYLSGEWINWENYQTHLPREIKIMRQLEQQLDD
ncbi:MAG: sugar phosphate isomerase/epimerase family protein [Lentisphaeria bacterium]